MAESPEVRYYRERKQKEEENRKNKYKMAQAVRAKLLEQEKSRSLWQKTKDYFSGRLLESEKANPETKKQVKVKSDSMRRKKMDRTSQTVSQLKKAGLTDSEIKKLKGN